MSRRDDVAAHTGVRIRAGRFTVELRKLPKSWRSRWGIEWLR